MTDLPKRKRTRLKEFDYSTPGAYFVTICTKDRKQLLSKIVEDDASLSEEQNVGQGLAPAENRLSTYGEIVKEQIELLEERYINIKIDKYIIMPNHIHLLILVHEMAGASPCPTISDIVCALKSLISRNCRKIGFNETKLFQTSFHDHIIRGEKDYQKIWEYIDTNVIKWKEDCFYNEK